MTDNSSVLGVLSGNNSIKANLTVSVDPFSVIWIGVTVLVAVSLAVVIGISLTKNT